MSRVAVVTGANQGLGFALAEGLVRRMAAGDIVYLTGRGGDRLRKAATRLTAPVADVDTHVLDVRDGAAVAAFADELRDRHGGVDIVFSNAAACHRVPFAENVSQWQHPASRPAPPPALERSGGLHSWRELKATAEERRH